MFVMQNGRLAMRDDGTLIVYDTPLTPDEVAFMRGRDAPTTQVNATLGQHKMNPGGRGFRIPLPVSGRYFYPLDPQPGDFDVRDVAHKLAFQCRYGGGTIHYYSVAEHCVLLSHVVPPAFALDALLHDRAEAYWQDLIRPKKRLCQPWYGIVEEEIERVSAPVFNVQHPIPRVVMEADYRICIDEKQQAYTAPYEAENDLEVGEPLGVTLQYWSPETAKTRFMQRYLELVA